MSTYNIPLNGELDMLGIYIDNTLPTLDIPEQINVIQRYLNATDSSSVSFMREGDTDCILMCPDNFLKTPGVQWKIGNDLETAKTRINMLRNHFNEVGMQNQRVTYNTKSCNKCGKMNNLKKCGRCNKVLYCSVDCQRSDWKQHKKTCIMMHILNQV